MNNCSVILLEKMNDSWLYLILDTDCILVLEYAKANVKTVRTSILKCKQHSVIVLAKCCNVYSSFVTRKSRNSVYEHEHSHWQRNTVLLSLLWHVQCKFGSSFRSFLTTWRTFWKCSSDRAISKKSVASLIPLSAPSFTTFTGAALRALAVKAAFMCQSLTGSSRKLGPNSQKILRQS